MKHPLLAAGGEKLLLLGNEAIVRGALEAGVNFVACYPGTPSSEIPDTFYRLRESGRYYMEYSTNEKVAFEVAAGAALGGALSLSAAKMVGVNVAADGMFTVGYTGTPGGLLMVSADDPGCHSSQNEQDNRIYARFMGYPCMEPASAQECKDMTKEALLLSREVQQPFMLRTTTRINHLRGDVQFGNLPEKGADIVDFKRDVGRFVTLPATAKRLHHVMAAKLEEVRELVEKSHWNTVRGKGKLGLVAAGVSRSYMNDALMDNGWENEVSVFELGFSWPMPTKKLLEFMKSVDKLLVIEELEPIIEKELRALAQENNLKIEILGKGGPLTIYAEYDTPMVAEAIALALGKSFKKPQVIAVDPLPIRPPNLCAGCAHRAVYYAVRQTFGDEAYYSSDIGCYTLGVVPPMRCADFNLCMGSSVSSGSGFAKASGKLTVSFIGDSTFFHSGMTGLANALFNKHDQIIVIMDNGTTAMTGHQPNPGMTQEVIGETKQHLDIESIVKGMGVEQFAKVKGYSLKSIFSTLEEMKGKKGVRVILAEEPCVLFARRTLKRVRPNVSYVEVQGPETLKVAQEFACPAFNRTGDNLSVDPSLCAGCMICMQISKNFKAHKKESQND